MPKIKCTYCDNEFYQKPSRITQINFCKWECYLKYNEKVRAINNINIIDDNISELIITKKDGVIIKVLIDTNQIEKINKYKWQARYDKTINNYYIRAWEHNKHNNRKSIILHRYLTDCTDNLVVDHIDRNTLNNMVENLKVCTQKENALNKGHYKNNKSGYKSVYYETSKNKYVVGIVRNKQKIYGGTYKTLQEAIKARDILLERIDKNE